MRNGTYDAQWALAMVCFLSGLLGCDSSQETPFGDGTCACSGYDDSECKLNSIGECICENSYSGRGSCSTLSPEDTHYIKDTYSQADTNQPKEDTWVEPPKDTNDTPDFGGGTIVEPCQKAEDGSYQTAFEMDTPGLGTVMDLLETTLRDASVSKLSVSAERISYQHAEGKETVYFMSSGSIIVASVCELSTSTLLDRMWGSVGAEALGFLQKADPEMSDTMKRTSWVRLHGIYTKQYKRWQRALFTDISDGDKKFSSHGRLFMPLFTHSLGTRLEFSYEGNLIMSLDNKQITSGTYSQYELQTFPINITSGTHAYEISAEYYQGYAFIDAITNQDPADETSINISDMQTGAAGYRVPWRSIQELQLN